MPAHDRRPSVVQSTMWLRQLLHSDAALSWASDLDGSLVDGATLKVVTIFLVAHALSVTATDFDGMHGTNPVTNDVGQRPPAAVPAGRPAYHNLDSGPFSQVDIRISVQISRLAAGTD